MGTNYKKAPLSAYAISKTVESLNGYNYYMFIHPMGQVIIMRENTSGNDFAYADGGFDSVIAWTDKETLTYTDYDKLG